MKSKSDLRIFNSRLVRIVTKAVKAQWQIWSQTIQSGVAAGRTQYLVTLTLIVGVVAGTTAHIFHSIINFLSTHTIGELIPAGEERIIGNAHLFLIPAVGGLIVGGLMSLLRSEHREQGVPEVIHSLLKKGGVMKIRATFVKAWAAIFTIGSGGSAGPEGPIAEIGASTGSFLGRILSVPPQITRMLVAGGAAGGIAASFHAPIGGVFFALEVLLSEFTPQAFSLVVLATTTSFITSRAISGGVTYFSAPLYSMGSNWELILFALLGITAGFAAKFYVRFLDGVEGLFNSLKRFPLWLKPALGGLIVGGLALLTPQVLGSGHTVIEQALWGNLPLQLMLALILAKTLATSVTLGSGGIGGVFLPGFVVGSMLGGAFGLIAKFVLGYFGITALSPSGAYALVGMAALLAGSTRAPMTSVIIIFEITNDYHMIIPVMMASVLSTMIARSIESSTIYTRHLSLRGIREPEHKSVRALESTMVGEIMTPKVVTISPALPIDRLARLVETRGHSGFPVVNDKKELVGLVTFDELRNALGVEDLPHVAVVAGDLMRSPPPTIYPDQTIGEALGLFSQLNIDRLPVVARGKPSELLGIITQSDVLRIYRKLLL